MKKLMIILLMLSGVVSALPENVGTNVARIIQYHNYCEELTTFGTSQIEMYIEALGGSEEVLGDEEFLNELETINEIFSEEGSQVSCATLKFLLTDIGLYRSLFN